jgi:uncharacterized membrane protein
MSAPLRRDAKIVIGAFLVSGTVHLVKPEVYEPLMPSWVPAHREVILASGVAELVGALGMMFGPTRRLAGLASAALLLGVYPGNIKMAVDASKTRSTGFKAAAYARLPLQLPMIRGAWRAGKA